MISGLGRARPHPPMQLLALQAVAVDRALVDARVEIDVTTV
jgi:hypothetical protein